MTKRSKVPMYKSICLCGHTGDGAGGEHSDIALSCDLQTSQRAPGHGACTALHCGCRQFTWARFIKQTVTP